MFYAKIRTLIVLLPRTSENKPSGTLPEQIQGIKNIFSFHFYQKEGGAWTGTHEGFLDPIERGGRVMNGNEKESEEGETDQRYRGAGADSRTP